MKAIKIIGVIVLVLIILGVVFYFSVVGFTKEQKFNNCVETCEEMVLLESSKQHCRLRCEEVTGYIQKADDKKENQDTTNKTSSTAEPSEEREYYCEWVWPQKIIDRQTKEVIVSCPNGYPWCNRADYKYENVGCCKETDYQDCLKLSELIN